MFTPSDGGGWRLARSLWTLAEELNAYDPDWVCLGTIGDQAHAGQDAYSDHNPNVLDPATGVGIVRAIDIVPTDKHYDEIFWHFQDLYARRDPRLWPYGYAKTNGQITDWDHPGGVHPSDGDYGHIHLSVTQSSYPSQAGGYLAAIDSRAPWGLGGRKPEPPESREDDDMLIITHATDRSKHSILVGGGKPAVLPNRVLLDLRNAEKVKEASKPAAVYDAYLAWAVAPSVDVEALARAIAAKLDVADLTSAEIEQAVRAVFADAGDS